jgi:branched-chain amino acid transport system permease protein
MGVGALCKEAGLTAFVVLMLALPLAGLRIVGTATGLSLKVRPLFVIVPVLIAFVGRFVVMGLWRRGRRRRGEARPESIMDRISRGVSAYEVYLGPLFLLGAIVLPFMPFSDRYIIDTATTVLIYVMLGWGLNIVVGLAGLLDLGYVAFYAVGAYSYALLATHFGWSFWACLPLAGVFAAAAGVILGFPVLRLRGDYLAIVTLGFGEIIRLILLNWYNVTNGPDGISRIPRPSFFGLEFTRRPAEGETAFHQFFDLSYAGEHRVIFLYFLILVLALCTNLFTQRIRKLPVGRAW